MANKQITELDPQATYDGTYYVPVDDAGFAEAKKMTLAVLTGTEATARENADNAIIAGVGLESDGSFNAITGSNYLEAADFAGESLSETVKNALTLLDTQIKANTDAITGYSGITEATVMISGESLLGLATVPYDLVAAPGAGYVIDLISVVGFLDYGGGAIDAGTDRLEIRTETGDVVATFTNAFYESAADIVQKGLIADNPTLRVNEKLRLHCDTDDSGGVSTSKLFLYLAYRIVAI